LADRLWRKHYESVYTKFYQAYVLPVKFGIDKRKASFIQFDLIRPDHKRRGHEEFEEAAVFQFLSTYPSCSSSILEYQRFLIPTGLSFVIWPDKIKLDK